MYDSAPTQREGEHIEQLVPEAILTTANSKVSAAHAPATRSGQDLRSLLRTPGPARTLAWVALIEGIALLAVLAGWVVL